MSLIDRIEIRGLSYPVHPGNLDLPHLEGREVMLTAQTAQAGPPEPTPTPQMYRRGLDPNVDAFLDCLTLISAGCIATAVALIYSLRSKYREYNQLHDESIRRLDNKR